MNMNQGAKILLEAAIKGTVIQELQDDGQWRDLTVKEAIAASANQLDNEGKISTLRFKPSKIVWYIPVTKHSRVGLTTHTPVATFSTATCIAEGWLIRKSVTITEADRPKVQAHRQAWLDLLIKEFSE